LEKTEPDWLFEVIENKQVEQEYYWRLQFKVVILRPSGNPDLTTFKKLSNLHPSSAATFGHEIEIADGGFTDGTQRLSGNRKERLLISGMGLELLYKMRNGLI
jgi:hypothetical protein